MTRRPLCDSDEHPSEQIDSDTLPKKRPKLGSHPIKDIRSTLKGNGLGQFLLAIDSQTDIDIIAEYFRDGGTCLELFQLLDFEATPVPTVMEITTRLINAVCKDLPDMFHPTLEACRYVLNTHVQLLNDTLAGKSPPEDRVAVLRLLTAMITLSKPLLKDILLNVKFSLMHNTKHCDDPASSPRVAFIEFLNTVFTDATYHTLTLMITNIQLFTSIIHGLRFDPVEVVATFLTTLKTHLVFNESVQKPLRVKIFARRIIKGLSYLYTWKGPTCYHVQHQKEIEGDVDEADRETIARLNHEILLQLCTSVKHGIIFRDNLVGLGSQPKNPGMFNIVEINFGDARGAYAYNPWHAELVVRMVVECPDMLWTLWENIYEMLAPRPMQPWFRRIQFMRSIIEAAKLEVVIHFAEYMTPLKFAQVTQTLVAPAKPIEMLFCGTAALDNFDVKPELIKTALVILQGVARSFKLTKECLPTYYHQRVKALIVDHLQRHLPSAEKLLSHWKDLPANAERFNRVEYMNNVVQVIAHYYDLCPLLISKTLTFDDITNVHFPECTEADAEEIRRFKMNFIHLMTLVDPSKFYLHGELFSWTLHALSSSLRLVDDELREDVETARQCALNILRFTGLFTNCAHELHLWVEILKHEHAASLICSLALSADAHAAEITRKIKGIQDGFHDIACFDDAEVCSTEADILKTLCDSKFVAADVTSMKPTLFSRLLVAALQQKVNTKLAKELGFVVLKLFHLQSDYRCLQRLVQLHPRNLPEEIRDYIVSFPSAKAKIPQVADVSDEQLRVIDETSWALFRILNVEISSEECATHTETIKKRAVHMLDTIYCNPKMLRNFRFDNSVISLNSVQCLSELTASLRYEHSARYADIKCHISAYQRRLYKRLMKIVALRDPGLSKNVHVQFTKAISHIGLSNEGCRQVLERFASKSVEHFLDDGNKPNLNYLLLVAILESFAKDANPMTNETDADAITRCGHIESTLRILTELNNKNINCPELAAVVCNYFKFHRDQANGELIADYFLSAVQREEFCRENAQLALMFFKSEPEGKPKSACVLQRAFEEHLDSICQKKGLILPLLECVDMKKKLAERVFGLMTTMLSKTLQKPSKAGAHMENHYKGFCELIEAHVPTEFVAPYLKKIQKAETTDAFLPAIWKAMFLSYMKSTKISNDEMSNGVMTFVHFAVNMFKVLQKKNEDSDNEKILKRFELVLSDFDQVIDQLPRGVQLDKLKTNETYKLFTKFSLKHGIGSPKLCFMKTLGKLTRLVNLDLEESRELLELLSSHSEFMNVSLEGPTMPKFALYDFVCILCKAQPEVLEKKHVPLLLSAYNATIHPSDRRVLTLLLLCEEQVDQTEFHSFKPYLWGVAAANFYSVRTDTRRGLWRQPRTGDILDILQPAWIENTLINFPLNTPLRGEDMGDEIDEAEAATIYDIWFILCVCEQLLSTEVLLLTHRFTRSGVMSIVTSAFSSRTLEVRTAACHVLSKFYYHLETKRAGKDAPLWLRFVEVVAKEVGSTDEHKLNCFASLMMARTAIVISNPTDPMYANLSNFLGVTSAPSLAKIPELHTFLNSGATDYKTRRHFILQILLDGLRTEEAAKLLVSTNGLKMIMDYFNSILADDNSRRTIMEIVARAAAIENVAWSLCHNYGLSIWLYNAINANISPVILEKANKIYDTIISHSALKPALSRIATEIEKFRFNGAEGCPKNKQ